MKFLSTIEKAHLMDSLNSGLRIDLRELDETRVLNVTFDENITGSVNVSLGNTKLCVTTNVKTKELETPNKSRDVFQLNIDVLDPTAFVPSDPTQRGHICSPYLYEIIHHIKEVINSNKIVEFKGTTSSQISHVLETQILVINNDGNLIDACFSGLLCSFLHLKSSNEEDNDDNSHLNFDIKFDEFPLSFTFSMFDNNITVADPNLIEQALQKSSVIVILDPSDQIVNFLKYGGCYITIDSINQLYLSAANKTKSWNRLIYTTLAQYKNNSKKQDCLK